MRDSTTPSPSPWTTTTVSMSTDEDYESSDQRDKLPTKMMMNSRQHQHQQQSSSPSSRPQPEQSLQKLARRGGFGFGGDDNVEECDFDLGPTNIWMLIEDRDWDGVMYQAQNFPREARTFVFRKKSKGNNIHAFSTASETTGTSNTTPEGGGGAAAAANSNNLRWRMLPLHAAVISDAPAKVIQMLLQAYPEGAKCVDDHGMLPIHLAIKKHADPTRINLLLGAYPDCVGQKNSFGQRPQDMAKSSSSPYKNYYIRATKRGSPTYVAVTNPLSDLMCGIELNPFASPMLQCS